MEGNFDIRVLIYANANKSGKIAVFVNCHQCSLLFTIFQFGGLPFFQEKNEKQWEIFSRFFRAVGLVVFSIEALIYLSNSSLKKIYDLIAQINFCSF